MQAKQYLNPMKATILCDVFVEFTEFKNPGARSDTELLGVWSSFQVVCKGYCNYALPVTVS